MALMIIMDGNDIWEHLWQSCVFKDLATYRIHSVLYWCYKPALWGNTSAHFTITLSKLTRSLGGSLKQGPASA